MIHSFIRKMKDQTEQTKPHTKRKIIALTIYKRNQSRERTKERRIGGVKARA